MFRGIGASLSVAGIGLGLLVSLLDWQNAAMTNAVIYPLYGLAAALFVGGILMAFWIGVSRLLFPGGRNRGGLQVEIAGWFPDMEPVYSVLIFWKDELGHVSALERPNIHAMFQITLINYRTDRKERLLKARVVLEKRFLFWRTVMATAPVCLHDARGTRSDQPLENIVLEPQSAPHVSTVVADGPVTHPVATFPRRSKLTLEMDFVGPLRQMRRTLTTVKHDRQALHKVGTRT